MPLPLDFFLVCLFIDVWLVYVYTWEPLDFPELFLSTGTSSTWRVVIFIFPRIKVQKQ